MAMKTLSPPLTVPIDSDHVFTVTEAGHTQQGLSAVIFVRKGKNPLTTPMKVRLADPVSCEKAVRRWASLNGIEKDLFQSCLVTASIQIEGLIRTKRAVTPATGFPLTETGDAEYFTSLYSDRVRYDHRRGRWLLFSGQHWEPERSGEVYRLALKCIRKRQEAAFEEEGEQRSAMMKWSQDGESRRRQNNLIAISQNIEPIADSGDNWDRDPWLLGVQNGVVDLRTGTLRSGKSSDRITLRTSVAFDPDATCGLWNQTIDQVFGGDQDLISYVYRFLGYSLTGDCREEVLALCWGNGANGKGTVMNTFGWMLGDYSDDLPFTSLEEGQGSINNDIAKIVGKRFVTSSESGEARRLNEARVKALTGRDPITARFLHREFFTFQPVAKFWLATNSKPVVRDSSLGFWRRIHLIPFTRSFASAPDLQLKDKLRRELPGILTKCVRACLEWQQIGLRPPKVVLEATNDYREASLPIAKFIEERCILTEEARTTFGDLFEAYVKWCGHGHRLGKNEFRQALEDKFQRFVDARQKVCYLGIGLASRNQFGEI